MKKTRYLLIFVFLFFVACGRASTEPYEDGYYDNIIEEASYYYYVQEQYDPRLNDVFTSGRTRGEYIYDLDFLYNTLLENFPFIDAVLRSNGADLHARYEQTREQIMIRNDFPSDEHFAATIRNFFIGYARGLGHLAVMLRDAPIGLIDHIQAFSHSIEHGGTQFQAFLDEINNPATRVAFNLTDEDFLPPPVGVESFVYASTSDNVHTYIIEEGRIAYVNIMMMNFATKEIDRITLLDFFNDIANYDHLIVDIRQNPGGDGRFFTDLVMSPNISQPLRFEQNVFLMGGEHSKRLLAAWFETEDLIRPFNPDVIANFPYFRQENIPMFNYHLHNYIYVEPLYETGIFGGKVWLLIGPNNFSAAEFALSAAKQTGFATLVGAQSGGGGLGLQPLMLALPNSGVIVRYSASYAVDHMGRENYEHGTAPHYFNRTGMDALQTVLAMIEEGLY